VIVNGADSPQDPAHGFAELGLAALDPGRSKCGLAVTDRSGQCIVGAAILPPEESLALLRHWQTQGLGLVVLGNGTGSAGWRERLAAAGLASQQLDEWGTTLAARQRYWQLEPPRGWRRCLPRGLRLPPRDIDDVVAQLLLERHLGRPLPRRCGPPGPIGARSGPVR
jgi:RNase H-fold protein (predicted Holliday junction resolvase)